MGLWVSLKKLRFSEPSIAEIQDLFYIQPISKNVGWYFLSSIRGKAFFRGQKKTNHAWKKLFFLLDGKWEFEDYDLEPDVRVPRNYCLARSLKLEASLILKYLSSLSEIEQRLQEAKSIIYRLQNEHYNANYKVADHHYNLVVTSDKLKVAQQDKDKALKKAKEAVDKEKKESTRANALAQEVENLKERVTTLEEETKEMKSLRERVKSLENEKENVLDKNYEEYKIGVNQCKEVILKQHLQIDLSFID
ncbi:hypothetical protein OWV82_010642 [Melia azedarach]|uniref:Uncharacterized protein n=1 Tax=Melia azedarach TaxID=155640 RepID=A0ACC1Y5P3_MELAZ|nr:hypothetical protein OWV82_010642 [Melia azedarach]